MPFQSDGAPYTILISGKNNKTENNVDLTYSGPGFTIGFDGISVDPGEVISMTISPDGEQLSFTSSSDGETPEIYYAVDYGDRSTKFELDGGKLKPGKTLTVNYDIHNNIFNFSDNDGDTDEYDVDYTRYNPDGTIWYYETGNIDFGTSDRYQMDFSKWNGTGAVGVKADNEGDGFDDDEYVAQPMEDNDNDPDDADDEGDDEDSDIDNAAYSTPMTLTTTTTASRTPKTATMTTTDSPTAKILITKTMTATVLLTLKMMTTTTTERRMTKIRMTITTGRRTMGTASRVT